MAINVILVMGASGSGTSTLGRALEQAHGYKWLDTDDYYWQPTDPPFVTPRPINERGALLVADIAANPKCVITGSIAGSWTDGSDALTSLLDMVVWLHTPTEIRIARLHAREYARFGERILVGGDMYDNHQTFIEWARHYDASDWHGRHFKMHEEWVSRLSCPVLRVDGAQTTDAIVQFVMRKAQQL